MVSRAFSRFKPLTLLLGVLIFLGGPPVMSQLPPDLQQLIKELPPCSILRAELERGNYGGGVDQPYMGSMRAQGVQRALVELTAVFHGNRVENTRVVRRLYFRRFDGANSQISDEPTLTAIDTSGLAMVLDDLARDRIQTAPLVRGYSGSPGDGVSGFVEFFANAWLPEQKPILFPAGQRTALIAAVINGDAVETRALLGSSEFDKKRINGALLNAVLSRYDNTAIIELLLNAGANVNTRTADGTTPLMNAVAHPCNLHPLLDHGADVIVRDKWGRDALQLAREAKVDASIRLLEQPHAK